MELHVGNHCWQHERVLHDLAHHSSIDKTVSRGYAVSRKRRMPVEPNSPLPRCHTVGTVGLWDSAGHPYRAGGFCSTSFPSCCRIVFRLQKFRLSACITAALPCHMLQGEEHSTRKRYPQPETIHLWHSHSVAVNTTLSLKPACHQQPGYR